VEEDYKIMLKKRKTYQKPSIGNYIVPSAAWPLAVGVAEAVGTLVGVGMALFGPKKVTSRPDKSLQ